MKTSLKISLIALTCAFATNAWGAERGMARVMEYGWNTADARFPFGGRKFSIYIHPKENVFLIQPSIKDISSNTEMSTGKTVIPRLVAQEFLKPIPTCVVNNDINMIAAGSFEVAFTCDIDLHDLMRKQRKSLVSGNPLNVEKEMK